MVSSLYTISSFLRMGTYMLRCAIALRKFLSAGQRFRVEPAAIEGAARGHDEDRQFVEVLTDYLVANREGPYSRSAI